MELRQLRYFVSLAEELHFGRAAAREHIVQSALSQHLQRLERELGVKLVERSTHHVQLTAAGCAFLTESRQVLLAADRAAEAARLATGSTPVLRAGILDASYDTMPSVLAEVQRRHHDLEIHQVEVDVPSQIKMLLDGQLDVGFGPAWLAPPGFTCEVIRLDPIGVVVPAHDSLADLPSVPAATLADRALIFVDEDHAPGFRRMFGEICRSQRFSPIQHRGRVTSIRAAQHLVTQGRGLLCTPSSCATALNGPLWKPLVEPAASYPWSLLWHAANRSRYVRAVASCARVLAREANWLDESRRVTRTAGP